ncbi:MAG: Lrp/AsnC family transcriptional regulator [Aquabacterium sp.]|nr:Lrp/AsnC family transcriptional regulator [Aquabacterium sp.]
MSTTPELDDTDIQLLSLLQQDASPSNQALADRLGLSPATCHRRVKRLKDEGYIERQVAILSPQKMADALGWGLSALVEISLDVQTQEALDAFEQRALTEAEVQQCWRVSPGPDFILVVQVVDMPAYHALSRRLFTQDSQVRNVRAFFAVKRAKFGTQWPLPRLQPAPSAKRPG